MTQNISISRALNINPQDGVQITTQLMKMFDDIVWNKKFAGEEKLKKMFDIVFHFCNYSPR